jgi:DNA-directed RNA polymerase III subunit RPC6
MLYDATPTKDITGGPWYTDQEFDHEFIEELHSFIVQLVSSKGMLGIGAISESVTMSGISRVIVILIAITSLH